MKKLLKKAWVKALRSDKYKQSRGYLELCANGKIIGNCCLGVLCRVAKVKGKKCSSYTIFSYNNTGSLGGHLRSKFEISLPEQEKLIDMNDNKKKNFNEISNWIEKNL